MAFRFEPRSTQDPTLEIANPTIENSCCRREFFTGDLSGLSDAIKPRFPDLKYGKLLDELHSGEDISAGSGADQSGRFGTRFIMSDAPAAGR